MTDPQAIFAAGLDSLGIDLAGSDARFVLSGQHEDQQLLARTMCRHCRQGLQVMLRPDGKRALIHARVWEKYDHEPDPIEIPAGATKETLCDFCGSAEEIRWHFRGARVVQRTGNLIKDPGDTWGACDTCGLLLQRQDLEGLLDRALTKEQIAAEGLTLKQIKDRRLTALAGWVPFLGTITEVIDVRPDSATAKRPARLTPQLMPKIQVGLVRFWNNTGIKELLHHPDRAWSAYLPSFCCGDTGTPTADDFCRIFEPGIEVPESAWDGHVRHLSAGIWKSDLYWVSSQFTQLANVAGRDLNTATLTREDLPSDNGVLIWEDSVGALPSDNGRTAAIRAVTWNLIPGGVWCAYYAQGEDADPDVDVALMRQKLGWLICPNMGGALVFDEHELGDDSSQVIRTLLATWFLLNQPGVAEVTHALVDKREARKYQRNHQRQQPEVRLINLRKQPQRHQPNDTGPRGPIDYRVYRKGHWKNQPYGPKRGQRREIYVAGYIAGPDGAPLRPPKADVKVLK